MASATDKTGAIIRVAVLGTSGTAKGTLQCVTTSGGAADAGKIVLLNAAGKLDASAVTSWHAGDTGSTNTWLAGNTA